MTEDEKFESEHDLLDDGTGWAPKNPPSCDCPHHQVNKDGGLGMLILGAILVGSALAFGLLPARLWQWIGRRTEGKDEIRFRLGETAISRERK